MYHTRRGARQWSLIDRIDHEKVKLITVLVHSTRLTRPLQVFKHPARHSWLSAMTHHDESSLAIFYDKTSRATCVYVHCMWCKCYWRKPYKRVKLAMWSLQFSCARKRRGELISRYISERATLRGRCADRHTTKALWQWFIANFTASVDAVHLPIDCMTSSADQCKYRNTDTWKF